MTLHECTGTQSATSRCPTNLGLIIEVPTTVAPPSGPAPTALPPNEGLGTQSLRVLACAQVGSLVSAICHTPCVPVGGRGLTPAAAPGLGPDRGRAGTWAEGWHAVR